MAVLALDVGSKRIGMAVSDPTESFALPLTIIERANLQADIDRILAFVAQYRVGDLVVGYPLRLSGEVGPAATEIDRFIAALGRRFPGQIHRVDERLTTAQATKTLIGADVSRRKRKGIVDKIAAALILESFLARRSRQGSR